MGLNCIFCHQIFIFVSKSSMYFKTLVPCFENCSKNIFIVILRMNEKYVSFFFVVKIRSKKLDIYTYEWKISIMTNETYISSTKKKKKFMSHYGLHLIKMIFVLWIVFVTLVFSITTISIHLFATKATCAISTILCRSACCFTNNYVTKTCITFTFHTLV